MTVDCWLTNDRTTFSSLEKRKVGRRPIPLMIISLTEGQHDQMKRYIAASYANTNIMHPDVLDGIQERVDTFLRHCEAADGQAIDFYVRNLINTVRMRGSHFFQDYLHCFAMDCASFHLLHPHGTKSIEGRDLNLMKEYSYGDTLRSMSPSHLH